MTKLCPRGKAAAKRKFKVYPSAYANAYASKICAGKIKDPSGVKRKDFKGPKPSGAKVGMAVTAGAQSGMGRLEKSGLKKANKGKLMIIIGVGKAKKRDKMKVQKKMGGGLSAATEKLKAQGLSTGGGFDAGTPGKLRDIASRYESDGIRFKPGRAPKLTPDRRRRLQNAIERRNKKQKIKKAIEKAVTVANPVVGAISAGKKIIDKMKSSKTQEQKSSSVSGGATQRGKQNRRPVKKIPVMEASTGGIARGAGAAIRGTKFQGVF